MTITDQQLRILGTITTRDGAGRHFTEVFNGNDLEQLEDAGLIEITRPVHPTGIPYSAEYSTVEVTEAGQYEVDAALDAACPVSEEPAEDDFEDHEDTYDDLDVDPGDLDVDAQSALESVYGPEDGYDFDGFNCGGYDAGDDF